MTNHVITFNFCSDLPWAQMAASPSTCCSQPACSCMTVCVVVRMLSSSVEYLSGRLYNSSIVADRSKDSEWKSIVDGSKLL